MNTSASIAVITGAGRATGIGFEVAAQLASRGFKVIITARNEASAHARASELSARGLDVVGRVLDVTSETAVRWLAADIGREFGRLDVLINNAAGVASYSEQAASAELNRAHEVLEVTLFGAWRVSQRMLPLLRASAHGRIVNVSSGAGSHGDPVFGLTTGNSMGTSYAVAKAALNALTVKLANEAKEGKVLVNAVCPGFTATFEGGGVSPYRRARRLRITALRQRTRSAGPAVLAAEAVSPAILLC